jgi:hypothetical protein
MRRKLNVTLRVKSAIVRMNGRNTRLTTTESLSKRRFLMWPEIRRCVSWSWSQSNAPLRPNKQGPSYARRSRLNRSCLSCLTAVILSVSVRLTTNRKGCLMRHRVIWWRLILGFRRRLWGVKRNLSSTMILLGKNCRPFKNISLSSLPKINSTS